MDVCPSDWACGWRCSGSHSVYAGFLLAFVYLLLAGTGRAPWGVVDPRTAWKPVAAFLLIVLPYLVPMLLINRYYDLSRFHCGH